MQMMTEDTLEQTTLDWFSEVGYQIALGSDISPDDPPRDRHNHNQIPSEANNP